MKNRCEKGDTLSWTSTMTTWTLAAIDNFKSLQKIVNDRQTLVKKLKMEKSKLTVSLTSVSGKFCQYYMVSMNGTLRLQYLPVSGFKENLNYPISQVKLNNFKSFWSDYVESMIETK